MPKVTHIVKHYRYEPAPMKYITVSVDDEIYRLSRVKAAEAGTSVAGLVRSYLGSVDILSQPDERTGELEESQVASVQFVKPGAYPAKVLELVDEALHQLPLPG